MFNLPKNTYGLFVICLSAMLTGYIVPVFAAEPGTNTIQNIVSVPAGGTNIERGTKIVNLIPGNNGFETGVQPCVFDSMCGSATWLLDEAEKYEGRQSLKLRFIKNDWVRSKPIPISREQAGRAFTFSIYARADQDGISGTLYLVNAAWRGTHSKVINLTRNWQRYSLSAILKEGGYWLGFGTASTNQCQVWVDAYQLEDGDKPTPYRDREAADFGIDIPSEHGNMFFPDESVKVRILALNRFESANSLPLAWRVSDYYGRTVQSGEKQIKLDKDGFGREEIILNGLKLGFYSVRAGLKTKRGKLDTLSTFVVIRPPVKIEEGQIPFCGICGFQERFERIGAKWINNSVHWRDVKKVKGQYDFFTVSKPTNFWLKFTLSHLPSSPAWAWDKTEASDYDEKKISPAFGSGKNLLPGTNSLADWREFVRQFVEHYKDKVDLFEVGGEDDLTFGRHTYYLVKYKEHATNGCLVGGPALERYAEMLRIACHEIKQVAPQSKIGVIRPSGGDCTNVRPRYTFSEAVLRLCGINLEFDAFPLDCYAGTHYLGPKKPATTVPETFLPDDLNEALNLCRKYGRGQPVYISEFGYAMDTKAPPDSKYAKEMVKCLTRSYLIARMIKGVECLHWFFLDESIIEDGYSYGIWRDGIPLPAVAAYSVMARVVENVLEAREIPMGNVKAKVAVFRKKNQADAAIWLVNGYGEIVLNNVPGDLTAMDVMGNAMAGEKRGNITVFAIGEEPVYLNLSGSGLFVRLCNILDLPGLNSFDRLCNIIRSAALRITPLQIQLAEPCAGKGMVILHNQTGKDLNAKVVCTAGDISVTNEALVANGGKTETAFTLPPEFVKHEGKVNVEADCGVEFVKVTESFPVGSYMACERVATPITINGECEKWYGRTGIMMNNRGQILPPDPLVTWDGTNDLSAIVWIGWDETNFYFAAEVWDDLHFNGKTGQDIWNGDGFQMAFAPLAASDMGLFSAGYGPNDTEIGLSLAQGKPEVVQFAGPGKVWRTGNYTVKRNEAEKITCYEAAIPWVTLGVSPKPGKIFGFNFVLFDDDTGAGQNYWYQLSQGITNGKNSALFKRFVLSE